MPIERLASNFFNLATQYYVSARAATHAGLLPVPGNLFHHAIELFLKGDLCNSISADDLKKKLGHHLPLLWDAFTSRHPAEDFSAFAPCIAALDAFEDIRYPDEIVAKGMYSTISIGPFTPHIETPGVPPPGYHIVVQDLDAFIGGRRRGSGARVRDDAGRLSQRGLRSLAGPQARHRRERAAHASNRRSAVVRDAAPGCRGC